MPSRSENLTQTNHRASPPISFAATAGLSSSAVALIENQLAVLSWILRRTTSASRDAKGWRQWRLCLLNGYCWQAADDVSPGLVDDEMGRQTGPISGF